MKIDVALLPGQRFDPERSVCVVVDVLRASSSIVTLLERGATHVVAAKDTNEARQLHQRLPDHLLCGEEHGLPPEGFDYGNSPSEFSRLDLSGRPVILATSNGTRILAALADAPVLLVGDIDRGGVFAAFVGTMELLEPDERQRVAAFVVNKFRGDVALLRPGLEFLTERTKVPVLGVVPYLRALRIADENSVSLEDRRAPRSTTASAIDIAVVKVPRISNYDDFTPLEHEEGVTVRFVDRASDLEDADLVVLPGSKSTVSDLEWLRRSGVAERVASRAARGEWVLGICGGCQMLGRSIDDPAGVESDRPSVEGLGLLPLRTRFDREKITAQIRARVQTSSFLAPRGTEELDGYEIHMGRVEPIAEATFEIVSRNGARCAIADGAVGAGGAVVGTMIHGLFENGAVRASLLDALRERKGVAKPHAANAIPTRDAEYDRLAQAVRDNIDGVLLRRIARLGP